MKRTILVKRLACAAVLLALSFSGSGAEEISHHGDTVDSEGSAVYCLHCHDGLRASSIKLLTTVGRYYCNHPINRVYPPSGNSESYQPLEQVTSAGIKFLEGQITCISCHNLKNPQKYHLAIPLDRSNLCFSCHKI